MKIRVKQKIDLFIIALLIVITRLLFKSEYLYEWDSIQYALAINDFNIMWHQPHPPGYLFYILILKFCNIIFNNINNTFIFVNILFSILTALFLYLLSYQLFKNRLNAVYTCLLLIFSPIFWFYGEVATIYILEAFISVTIAFYSYQSLFNINKKYSLTLSLLFGFLAGIRQSILVLFFPLWLFTLSKHPRLKVIFLSVVFFICGLLIWFIPTIISVNGFNNYYEISKGLTSSGGEKIITFFGNTLSYIKINFLNFIIWLSQGVSPISCFFILNLILKKRKLDRIFFKNTKIMFFMFWIIPSTIFYAIIYIEKPGYLLTIIPAIILILVYSFQAIKNLTYFTTILTLFFLFQYIIWFIYPCGKNKIQKPSFIVEPPLSDYNWDISYREIKYKEEIMNNLYSLLSSSDKYKPDNTVIFYTGGYPTWRHLIYYFPQFTINWLVDKSNSGLNSFNLDIYYSQNLNSFSYSQKPFWVKTLRPKEIIYNLKPKYNNILWFLSPNTYIYNEINNNYLYLKKTKTSNNQYLFFSNDDQIDEIKICRFNFIKTKL